MLLIDKMLKNEETKNNKYEEQEQLREYQTMKPRKRTSSPNGT